MASYRGFRLDRDTTGLLAGARLLEPGERVRWVSDAGIDHYMVKDRNADGTETEHLWKIAMVVLKVVFFPVYFAYLYIRDLAFGGSERKKAPDAVIFGRAMDCEAVFDPRNLRVRPGRGLWVLTDRRFLRVKLSRGVQWGDRGPAIDETSTVLPLEPITCELDFAIAQPNFSYEPVVQVRLRKGNFKPQRPDFRRIVLRDGSGFALSPTVITDLL